MQTKENMNTKESQTVSIPLNGMAMIARQLEQADKPKDPVSLFIQEVRNRTQISHGASGGNKLTHLAHWFEVCAIEHLSGIKR